MTNGTRSSLASERGSAGCVFVEEGFNSIERVHPVPMHTMIPMTLTSDQRKACCVMMPVSSEIKGKSAEWQARIQPKIRKGCAGVGNVMKAVAGVEGKLRREKP
jgi:hypothetical protein